MMTIDAIAQRSSSLIIEILDPLGLALFFSPRLFALTGEPEGECKAEDGGAGSRGEEPEIIFHVRLLRCV